MKITITMEQSEMETIKEQLEQIKYESERLESDILDIRENLDNNRYQIQRQLEQMEEWEWELSDKETDLQEQQFQLEKLIKIFTLNTPKESDTEQSINLADFD